MAKEERGPGGASQPSTWRREAAREEGTMCHCHGTGVHVNSGGFPFLRFPLSLFKLCASLALNKSSKTINSHIRVSNHEVVYLKLTQCHMSIISQ